MTIVNNLVTSLTGSGGSSGASIKTVINGDGTVTINVKQVDDTSGLDTTLDVEWREGGSGSWTSVTLTLSGDTYTANINPTDGSSVEVRHPWLSGKTIFNDLDIIAGTLTDVTADGGIVVNITTSSAFSGGTVRSYSASNLPDGLLINGSTGQITGTLPNVSDTITATVTGSNQANSVSVTQDYVLTADVISSTSISNQNFSYAQSVNVDVSGNFTPSAGGTITYSISGASYLSINPSTGVITGTAPSADSTENVTVTGTDASGSTQQSFDVVVADVQVEPLSVDAEGWRLEIDTPDSSYDPDTSPVEFNITTQGHDALGNSVTYSESIALTSRIRNPLEVDPSATLNANDVSASKRIYSADTLPGAMTNNSTAAYPFCGFVWTVPNHQVLNIDDDMELGIYVSHMHARNGKPVAAVEFIIEDESGNTLSSGKITTLTDKTYTASSLHAPIYEHTFTAADLSGSSLEKPTTVAAEGADAPTCSVRAVFYPWRGTSHSTDDIMQGGEDIQENTSLTFLNNLGNYRPKSYAYVDATLGNDGTGVVSTDPATAQASPYATSGAAQTDIRNFYDARTQTRGYLENGHIRFEEGTHVLTTTSRTAAFRGHLIMEAADPANKTTTIITDNGSSSVEMATALWMRNLTIRRSPATSAPATFLTGDSSSTLLTEFVGTNLTCDDNGNGAGTFFGGVSTAFSSKFIKDCDHIADAPMITGNKMIGCDLPNSSTSTVGRVACNIRGYNINPNTTARVQGNLTGHCYVSYGKDAGNSSMVGIDEDIGVKGFHVVGSVLEMYPNGGSSGAGFRINGDGTQRTADNVVVQGITFPRYRANFLYLDNGTTNYQQRGVSQGCIWLEMNQKSDFYSAQDQSSANRTGNWKNRYGVDWYKNMIINGDSQGGTPISDNYQGSWLGEDSGLGSNTGTQENPLSITWTDDQSSASGGGDYTPSGSTTNIPKWGTDDAPYNVDLYGNALSAGTTVGAVAV